LYDIALVLTKAEDAGSMTRRMREGIEQHFRITVDRQPVSRPVMVMTAPEGSIRAERVSAESGGGLMAISGTLDAEGSGSVSDPLERTRRLMTDLKSRRADGAPIQGLSGTMSVTHLCDLIEHWSGRPVIDDTHVQGTFHIDVRSAAGTTEGFFDALRQQTGLVVTHEDRDVTTHQSPRSPTDPCATLTNPRGPQGLLRGHVAVLGTTLELSLGEHLVQQAFGLVFASADRAEGMDAFLEKRDPKFQGR
jgi:hypothetical protein